MMDIYNPYKHEGWIASISDGTTQYEGKSVPGERTPWQKLLQACKDADVSITGLRLQRGGVTITALPHKMCDGYFQAREAVKIMYKNVDILKYGIGSVVGDQIYVVWLELKPADGAPYIYSDIRPLDQNRVHTTL